MTEEKWPENGVKKRRKKRGKRKKRRKGERER